MKTLALIVATAAFIGTSFTTGATSEGIQRCQGPDGTAIYTDKVCGTFKAQPAPLSGELLTRIAMDDRVDGTIDGLGSAYRDASELLPTAPIGRRSLSGGCARSPGQLSADLIGAFALGDVNRIAESYHWTGMRHKQAMSVMQRLEQLSDKPLAEAKFLAAWIGTGDRPPEDAGLMQLVFAGDGIQVIDAGVRRQSGCYFIEL